MGRAIAARLASEGCFVTLFARRADVLQEAVDQINSDCGEDRAGAVAGDSMDPVALAQAVEATQARFGRLDIVVNNTGGPPAGDFAAFADEAWQDAFELTFMSSVRLTRLALPALRESGRGRIVNVTSSTVKEIAPGCADTARLKYLYSLESDPETARARDAAQIPARRFGDPDDIANVVAFLCSLQAAYINGVPLLVDGGLARGVLSCRPFKTLL